MVHGVSRGSSVLLLALVICAPAAQAEPPDFEARLPSEVILPAFRFATFDPFLVETSPRWRPDPEEGRPSSLLTGLHVGFAALQALDAHSTLKAVGMGRPERNRLMAPFSDEPGALIAVKAAAAAGTIFFSDRLGRKHRKAAIGLMIVLNAGYALVVAHNYRQSRR